MKYLLPLFCSALFAANAYAATTSSASTVVSHAEALLQRAERVNCRTPRAERNQIADGLSEDYEKLNELFRLDEPVEMDVDAVVGLMERVYDVAQDLDAKILHYAASGLSGRSGCDR